MITIIRIAAIGMMRMVSRILTVKKEKNRKIVRVSFTIDVNTYRELLDIAKEVGGIDTAIEKAIKFLKSRVSGQKILEEDPSLNEIKNTIIQAIQDLKSNILGARAITQARSSIGMQQLELPDLQKVESNVESEKKEIKRKDLEKAIDDVIVVAIAQELLEEKNDS